MRFPFSRPNEPARSSSKTDRLRQEISRLGSEAAVVAAASSAIADGQRKQMELLDAGLASVKQIADSSAGVSMRDETDAAHRSMAHLGEHAQRLTASTVEAVRTIAALGQDAQAMSRDADGAEPALARAVESASEITRATEALRARWDALAGSADQAAQHTTGLVASAQQVAVNAESAASAVDHMSGRMQELSRATDALAHTARSAADESAAAARRGESDAEAVRAAIAVVAGLREAISAADHAAGEVGARTRDIEGVAEQVNTLAERANLLSLNAAIEAARAGDAGRGFTIIAEELRSLTERAFRTSAQVTSVIQPLQTAVRHRADAAADHQRLLGDASAADEQARGALARIFDAQRTSAAAAERVAAAARQCTEAAATRSEETSAAATMKELTRAVAMQAQGAREALAAAQQTAAIVNDMRASLAAHDAGAAALSEAMDIVRRSTVSTSRRLREHAAAVAQVANELEALGRAGTQMDAAVATAAAEHAERLTRIAAAAQERVAPASDVARILTELRALAERTARSAHDSSTVSASLQQRVAALS